NRRLVAQGLQRIRKGHMQAGIRGLYEAAGRSYSQAATSDFGFALGPRINAAGRLADMTIGIECLLTDNDALALELARTLNSINRERQEIEGGMRLQAFALADELFEDGVTPPAAISVFDPDFHEGVVGIVASRVKDRLHRPTFVFAASQAEGKAHELKGSGRSIPGFHLRDALDLVAKRHPGVLLRFGGHAMAAGCTMVEEHFHTFEQAFAQVAQEWLDAKTLTRCVETDGPLDPAFRQSEVVEQLNLEVWGQGFAYPTFSEDVEILSQRLVGEKHLKLQLRHRGDVVDGIWFGRTEPLPEWVHMAFRLDINEFRGERKVQFLVEGTEG
ncbi:MAG: single-stranded-DNA-specific exonuclease RecJ, partial [Comamonas sp.]|nr:single-stranded-DNA-specific exonuclease RecJ [Comamonas sp.]